MDEEQKIAAVKQFDEIVMNYAPQETDEHKRFTHARVKAEEGYQSFQASLEAYNTGIDALSARAHAPVKPEQMDIPIKYKYPFFKGLQERRRLANIEKKRRRAEELMRTPEYADIPLTAFSLDLMETEKSYACYNDARLDVVLREGMTGKTISKKVDNEEVLRNARNLLKLGTELTGDENGSLTGASLKKAGKQINDVLKNYDKHIANAWKKLNSLYEDPKSLTEKFICHDPKKMRRYIEDMRALSEIFKEGSPEYERLSDEQKGRVFEFEEYRWNCERAFRVAAWKHGIKYDEKGRMSYHGKEAQSYEDKHYAQEAAEYREKSAIGHLSVLSAIRTEKSDQSFREGVRKISDAYFTKTKFGQEKAEFDKLARQGAQKRGFDPANLKIVINAERQLEVFDKVRAAIEQAPGEYAAKKATVDQMIKDLTETVELWSQCQKRRSLITDIQEMIDLSKKAIGIQRSDSEIVRLIAEKGRLKPQAMQKIEKRIGADGIAFFKMLREEQKKNPSFLMLLQKEKFRFEKLTTHYANNSMAIVDGVRQLLINEPKNRVLKEGEKPAVIENVNFAKLKKYNIDFPGYPEHQKQLSDEATIYAKTYADTEAGEVTQEKIDALLAYDTTKASAATQAELIGLYRDGEQMLAYLKEHEHPQDYAIRVKVRKIKGAMMRIRANALIEAMKNGALKTENGRFTGEEFTQDEKRMLTGTSLDGEIIVRFATEMLASGMELEKN